MNAEVRIYFCFYRKKNQLFRDLNLVLKLCVSLPQQMPNSRADCSEECTLSV